jgi:hypothetical protein
VIHGGLLILVTSMLVSCTGNHSMTPESSGSASGSADSTSAPASAAAPRIDDDRVIGPLTVIEATGTAAMWIPTRSTMLGGVRLSVPAPGGARLDDPALHRQAVAELGEIVGAPWPARVAGALTIHDHLLDAATRADYSAKGLRIAYDPPETRYYAWCGVIDGLHIEVTGAIGAWAAILIAQPLTAAEALDEGLPRSHPVDALALVQQVAPALAGRSWQPEPDPPRSNLFDVSLQDGASRLRAGVRVRGSATAEHYFYGARINRVTTSER